MSNLKLGRTRFLSVKLGYTTVVVTESKYPISEIVNWAPKNTSPDSVEDPSF